MIMTADYVGLSIHLCFPFPSLSFFQLQLRPTTAYVQPPLQIPHNNQAYPRLGGNCLEVQEEIGRFDSCQCHIEEESRRFDSCHCHIEEESRRFDT